MFKDNIHGLSVCVDYCDFLMLTYPKNKEFLASYTVITSTTDYETQNYCNINGIKLFITDVYKDDDSTFNKAKMLNKGLEYIYKHYPDDWVLSIDADTHIKVSSRIPKLNKSLMYGAHRMLYTTAESYLNGIGEAETFIREVQTHPEIPGYGPHAMIGYFQLFFKKNIFYDESCKSAEVCDHKFFFDNYKFNPPVLIESSTFNPLNLVCFHLGEKCRNWNGRVTPKWGIQ